MVYAAVRSVGTNRKTSKTAAFPGIFSYNSQTSVTVISEAVIKLNGSHAAKVPYFHQTTLF